MLVTVDEYDQVRAAQGATAQLGVLDSANNSRVNVGALAFGVLSTTAELGARFNSDGARAAQRASTLLKASLPSVDWPVEQRRRSQSHVELRGGFKTIRLLVYGAGIALALLLLILILAP